MRDEPAKEPRGGLEPTAGFRIGERGGRDCAAGLTSNVPTEMTMAERNKPDFGADNVDTTLQKTRQTVEAGADAARTATRTAIDGAATLGRQTGDAMAAGLDTGAAAGSDLAHALDTSADGVRGATSRLHDDANAVFAAQGILRTGLQELQRDWAAQWQEAVSRAINFERDLRHCGSLPEIFDRRRQFILEGIEGLVARQAEFLERSGQLWRKSLEPLRGRVGQAQAVASRHPPRRTSRASSGAGVGHESRARP